MSATWASDRFGTPLAPVGLRLSQELINTIPFAPWSLPDLLAGPDPAGQWLAQTIGPWCADRGEPAPRLRLNDAGLRRVRSLRARLRAWLSEPAGDASPLLEVPVTVVVRPGRAYASPRGTGAGWIESAVATELLAAHERDELRRLKLCRNDACTVGFYDRSKNNSRVWHDLSRCGTPMHVREYRKRLRVARDQTDPNPEVPS
jgi:hypothetical protein